MGIDKLEIVAMNFVEQDCNLEVPKEIYKMVYVLGFKRGVERAKFIPENPKDADKKMMCLNCKDLVHCVDCKYREEHHYEEEGEEPYIKYTCSNKYGLSKGYTVSEWDYCSRGDRKNEEVRET